MLRTVGTWLLRLASLFLLLFGCGLSIGNALDHSDSAFLNLVVLREHQSPRQFLVIDRVNRPDPN